MSSEKWCKFNPKAKYNEDAKFDKIIEFYLWSCPVEKTAYNATTFEQYGWVTPAQFKKLKNKLLNVSSPKIEFIGTLRSDFEEELKKQKMYDSKVFEEKIVIVNKNATIKDLFRFIRNSLAHGSFLVHKKIKTDDYYYFFECRNPDKNFQINARIVLKTSALVQWINIINKGNL